MKTRKSTFKIQAKEIIRIDTLIMKPKDYQKFGDNNNGRGYNYLYEIVGLDKFHKEFEGVRLVKDGYAKEFYSTGHDGLCQRVRTTLREFEKCFCDGEFGSLLAIVYGNVCKDANRSLAQEQYIHMKNQFSDAWLLPLIDTLATRLGKKRPSGSTEIYDWNIKSAIGRYYQSMTKKAIGQGWDNIVSHNFKGQSGWKLPIVGTTI